MSEQDYHAVTADDFDIDSDGVDGIENYSILTSNLTRNTTDWRDLLNTTLFQVRLMMMMMLKGMMVMTRMLLQDYPDWMLMSGFICCVIFLLFGLPGNIITILALVHSNKVSIGNTTHLG